MAETRVIDTNVLIVASAADDGSPFQPEATPVEESELRGTIFDWLEAFEQDPQRHVVLDYQWLIFGEYQHKLTEQDYGLLVMRKKMDLDQVVWVELVTDNNNHAVLPKDIATAVTDLEDRKMVAAVLKAKAEENHCKLTNACDTDWFDCKAVLAANGVEVEQLIEEWLFNKWQVKKKRA